MRARNRARVTPGKVTAPMPRTGKAAQRGHRENVAARQLAALALRRQGATYVQIGERNRTSNAQACRDVAAALAEVVEQRQESAAALLALELERIDWLTLTMTPLAQKGNTRAAMVILRTSERRSKLLGLDAAQRVELTGRGGAPLVEQPALANLTDAQLLGKLDAMRAALATPQPPEDLPPGKSSDTLSAREAYCAELAMREHNDNENGGGSVG